MILSFGGHLGSGKTLTALEDSFRLCERFKRPLVTNIALNPEGILQYAEAKGYKWLWRAAWQSRLYRIPDAESCLDISNAIVVLDEAGIFLNSRKMVGNGWKKFERFFSNLILSRKASVTFIWIAQRHEHVDKQIRDLTQHYFHCTNINQVRVVSQFDSFCYERWLTQPTVKNYLRGVAPFPRVGRYDPRLFTCYDTTDRLDSSQVAELPIVSAYAQQVELSSAAGGPSGSGLAGKLT